MSSFPSASPEALNRSSPSENSPKSVQPTVPATAPRPPPSDSATARSCVTCRRRKVRCNKRSPCSNCIKAGTECVFPPPGRAPRKSRRQPDVDLQARLRRLEGFIAQLSEKGADVNVSPSQIAASFSSATTASTTSPGAKDSTSTNINGQDALCPFEDNDPKKLVPRKFENEFGRLVIDEGRSRYVSNRLWASLGDEVQELQDILDHTSSDEEEDLSPESTPSSTHEGFLFGYHSLAHSLLEYHPPYQKVSQFWEVYKENVAPLITILHKPTVRNLLVEAAQHPESLDKNSEALVFTIYLSAVVSLKPDECYAMFGEDRKMAVRRYRFAVEQALSRAGFLNTQSLVLLQAAVLFIVCVRREDDSKFVWSLDALVLRLAQGLGIHRDGTQFALKPFETEMRRRLWWHICLMDMRSSEDHGTDPLIHESMYDTRLPLNVNDDDIWPEMTEAPAERVGCTEMTFCLVRCEITNALRRANYTCPGSRFRIGDSSPSIERYERLIRIINDRVEERYIKHCNVEVPIQWVAATVGRLVLAKMWLIVHHPMTRRDRSVPVSPEVREGLFTTAIELLEFGRVLEQDPKTCKWGWLFRTNMQWHGVAFVLSEICVRPICPVTDRAWNAVHSLYSDWMNEATHRKGMLWRPLEALMKRATATRAKQKEELNQKYGENNPPSFNASAPNFTPDHRHPLHQTHLPLDSQSIPSSQPNNIPIANGPENIDLTGGPWDTLRSIFPDTNIMAPAPLDTVTMPEPVSTNMLPTGLPFNFNTSQPGMNNQFMVHQQTIPEAAPLGWEEWDKVMRDFQVDLDNNNSIPGNVSNVTEWFV